MSNSAVRNPRIYLSSPHMGDSELEFVRNAFDTNWIAPLGPQVDAFENDVAAYTGVSYAAALSSGTAAIHLALQLLGVGAGDEVFCSSLTFCASANPIVYQGAQPVFIDSEYATWNMDPGLLAEELAESARRGRLPKAVVVVDLYGQCADYEQILKICAQYEVPVIEDAAEALGASYQGKKAGNFGKFAVFSFNGNKIITTSGGGMLLSEDAELIEKARFFATQARDPAPHFQHSAIGYNYRMSNVLAGIGRGQMQVLDRHVEARRNNYRQYSEALGGLPGITFMPLHEAGEPNCWLTAMTVDPREAGVTREDIRLELEKHNIESRPVWKPMHLQPVFAGYRMRGGAVGESLFANGLCLPSGSNLAAADHERVVAIVRGIIERGRPAAGMAA